MSLELIQQQMNASRQKKTCPEVGYYYRFKELRGGGGGGGVTPSFMRFRFNKLSFIYLKRDIYFHNRTIVLKIE